MAKSAQTVYLLTFIISVHVALVTYFNSSFLSLHGVPDAWLGTLYAIGALLSLGMYFILPLLLRRFGAYRTLMASGLMAMLVFISLGFATHLWAILLLFGLSLTTAVPMFYILDILLENATISEDGTGDGRSISLTAINIAFMLAPITAGALIAFSGMSDLYIYAGLILVPFLYLAHRSVASFKDAPYTPFSPRNLWRTLTHSANIARIFHLQFLIKFFYGWMTIYMPVYLATHIGFSLAEIGVLFSIMLIPFVVLQWPLGHFVDKRYGEKEFMLLGLVIMIGTTYIFSFLTTQDFALWALLLFCSRIGAAVFEVMAEIYFFKQVDVHDADLIGSFRALRPVAYIVGPLLGSLLLFIIPMQLLFGGLAIILLTGVVSALFLHDTR